MDYRKYKVGDVVTAITCDPSKYHFHPRKGDYSMGFARTMNSYVGKKMVVIQVEKYKYGNIYTLDNDDWVWTDDFLRPYHVNNNADAARFLLSKEE